jgi:hypothetical protein
MRGLFEKFKLTKRLKPQGSRVRCSKWEIFLSLPTKTATSEVNHQIDRSVTSDQSIFTTASIEKGYPRIPCQFRQFATTGLRASWSLHIGVIKEFSQAGAAIELQARFQRWFRYLYR